MNLTVKATITTKETMTPFMRFTSGEKDTLINVDQITMIKKYDELIEIEFSNGEEYSIEGDKDVLDIHWNTILGLLNLKRKDEN